MPAVESARQPRRLPRVLRTRIMVAALIGGLVLAPITAPIPAVAAPPPLTGTVIVNQSFTGATIADPAWRGLGSTCLTGAPSGSTPSPTIANCGSHQSGPVPAIGTTLGYLQLTDTKSTMNGTLLYNEAIPASAGLSVEFEQYQYGGGGGDGIGFFLVDGATDLIQAGGTGGSLGYSQRYTTSGILGGYIGVGFDAFGNFYADGEGKGANCPVGQRSPSALSGPVGANVITLRGPGNGRNGYCYQASTTDPASNPNKPTSTLTGILRAPNGTTNPALAKRLVNVQVTPGASPEIVVQVDFGTGWEEVLRHPAPANMPTTFKFGFGGATGGVTDIHLLRNVVVRTIQPLADLQIVKQVDRTGTPLPAIITAGTAIPYQYLVTNAGLETVNTLTVADNQVATVTCLATTLTPAPDPASTTLCTGTHTVTAADVAAGVVTNSAQARALSPTSAIILSNTDSITVPLVSRLAITKAVTTAAPYVVGQQLDYTYTVTNTGGSTISTMAVTDNRAAGGTITCNTTILIPNQVATCTLTTTALASYLSPDGSLRNTATATGVTRLGQVVTSNQAQASIQIGTDIAVTKTVDNLSPLVGDQVTFTVAAQNIGPAVATGIVINDLLPTGLVLDSATPTSGLYDNVTGRWRIPTLASASPAVTLTIVATVSSARVITNSATLTALEQPDTNPANNTAAVSLNPVVPTADIGVNIFVDSPTIRVGGTATFTISATNNGPQAATGVVIADPLPSLLQFVSTTGSYSAATGNWTVGALAVGQTVSIDVVARATGVGTFLNTIGVAAVSPRDVNQSNDVDSTPLTVTAALADLQIVKTIVSGTTNVSVGDFVTYVATVTNAGPDTASDVLATETQIAGMSFQASDITASNPSQGVVDLVSLTWNIGSLAPGESVTFSIRAQVLTAGTKVSLSTVSSATTDDPVQSNNTDTASFTSGPAQVDLSVTKTRVGPASVNVGQSVSFTIVLRNSSAVDATDVVVFDPQPLGLTNITGVVSAGSFDPATGLWSLATVPGGGSETLTVSATAAQPRLVTNVVTVQSLNEADTDLTNNSASASVDVVASADLAIALSVTPTVAEPGDTVTYTLTVTNNGPSRAENIQAVDPLNEEAEISGFALSQGSFDAVAHVWNIGSLDSGDTATLTVNRTMTRTGSFLNIMDISQSSVPDPDLSNNQTQIIVEVPSADLSVTVAVDDYAPEVGQLVVITISARNLGPEQTSTAVVTVSLPAGLSYVSSAFSAGSYVDATGVWDIGALGVNAPAETLRITARYSGGNSAVDVARITASSPFDPVLSNNRVSFSFAGGADLPFTGSIVVAPLIAATVLLMLGIGTLLIGRRRRVSE